MWLDRLNELRRESKMSLEEISAKSGVPKSTVAKITSGHTKSPALESVRDIVHAMGYTLDDLEEKETPPANAEGVTPEEVADALVSAGFIKRGQDLSDADLKFLVSVGEMLRAWFGE